MDNINTETPNKISVGIWKDFYTYLKPYKASFLKLIVLMVLLGIMDATFPLLSKYAIDEFVRRGSLDGLPLFIGMYLSAVLALSLLILVFIKIAGRLETTIAHDIRRLGFIQLQELPLSYYDNKAVGWLLARMTSDITRLSETISWGIVDLAWGLAIMTGISIYMIILNPFLAMITLSVVPLLAVLSIVFQKKILSAQRKIRKINSQITGAFNEDIQGAKTTKTLVREEKNLEEFSNLTGSMRAQSIRAAILSSVYLPLVIGLGSVGTALAFSFGSGYIMEGIITYGTLVAFISYTAQFFEPIRQMAVIFAEFQSAQASAERVFSLLKEKPEIRDEKEIIQRFGDIFQQERELLPQIKGGITFENVSFSYQTNEPVLKNFNLDVNPSQTIALVGETGSGKSTIVNLFCRFYEPTEGRILVDGLDYKKMPLQWIHNNLGYVLQSPHLFSGTIKENIRYGKLDATDKEIQEACMIVNAHEFIMELEDGYDTQVGEGGGMLSTGQKQLISFARAIIRNPSLFVLDEATSSIDTETEKIIQDAITKVLKGRTSFVIAHRLSTIKNADRILVVKKGEIVEDGTHRELLMRKGYYHRLYTNQYLGEESI
ncbi:ABC transporter ATP-binding protein [Gudongella sp. SC589]|uniref:ABC transporter ATP-binding protein n=1 Tax=Gudongella sp. SC589 TaxID=3385990 RepID=UPI0039047F4B